MPAPLRRFLPVFFFSIVALGLAASPVFAQAFDGLTVRQAPVSFLPDAAGAAPAALPTLRLSDSGAETIQPPPVAFEYSDAYHARARVHRIASYATLPLFTAEALIGESLYNSSTDSKKSAHLVIGTAITALFAVNSVTGIWNLVEARKDPNGRTRRLVHGLLMLAADAGFVATTLTGPGGGHDRNGTGTVQLNGSKSLHRGIAFSSIGLATAGYFTMIIGGH